MEQTKTKKALIMSVLSMVLCIAMLIGMTFAWFTDTASTGVNKIQAGNLKVDIVDKEGNTLVGKELKWQKAAGHENEAVLWEPGCEYKLDSFKIVNKGNLALKYKVAITGLTGDAELLEAIDFTISDGTKSYNLDGWEGQLLPKGSTATDGADVEATSLFTITGKMKTTAGNEYQEKSIEGISITVVATQMKYESDSYGNTYDENAGYPEIKTVTDAASIAAAVADLAIAGNKNVLVTVAKNMDKTSGIKTAKGNTLTMDLNGKTVGVSYGDGSANTTTNGMQLLQGSTVTLKNGTYKANHGNNADHNIAILIQNYSNLTIDNCTLDMREANDTAGNSRGTSYALSTNCGKIVIKGNTNIYSRSGEEYALDVMHWENTSYKEEGTSVVFEESMTGTVDGKIDVYCYRNNRVVKPVDDNGATLVIKGGTFKNSGLSLEQFKAFVPAGYNVTTNADGSYTVSK